MFGVGVELRESDAEYTSTPGSDRGGGNEYDESERSGISEVAFDVTGWCRCRLARGVSGVSGIIVTFAGESPK